MRLYYFVQNLVCYIFVGVALDLTRDNKCVFFKINSFTDIFCVERYPCLINE